MGTTRSLKKKTRECLYTEPGLEPGTSSQDLEPGRNTGSVICNPLPEILATLEVTLSEICGQN